jgi:sugar lactone lactonase YvrE
VAVDRAGNVLIADSGNHVIRRVDPAGAITTVAGVAEASGFVGDGGPATAAFLNLPAGVAAGRNAELFIADTQNHCIRRVGPKGQISTVAGQGGGFGDFGGDGGPAADARLNFPTAVLLDGDDNLLIADSANGRVRRVDRDGIITTIAGGGPDTPAEGAPATSVRLLAPTSIAFDRAGGLIVGDERGHRLWRLTPAGTVPPSHGS